MRGLVFLTVALGMGASARAAGASAVADAARPTGPAVGAPDASRGALAEGLAALAKGPAGRNAARGAFGRAAAAGGAPATVAEAYLRLGVLDEGDAAPGPALAHYRACVDAATSSRWARTARSRIAWIDQRSEGDLLPLAALLRVRNAPERLHDPTAVDRLAVEAESFPAGLVRSETRMLVAEAWLKRAARRDDALGELRRIVADPSSGPADAVFAERDLVEALLADQRLDDAAGEVRAHRFDPKAEAEVQRLMRRRWLRRAAYAELLIALALVVVAASVRARVSRRPSVRLGAPAGGPGRRLPPWALAAVVVLGGLSTGAAAFVVADAAGSKHLQILGL
jgi:hypothetical protein